MWDVADELRTVMDRAAIPKPRILVAHSYGALIAIALVRLVLSLLAAGSQRLPKMIARASSGRSAAITDQFVEQVRIKLPSELWPIIQSHWCDPKCFEGMTRYLEALPQSASEVAQELSLKDALRDVGRQRESNSTR